MNNLKRTAKDARHSFSEGGLFRSRFPLRGKLRMASHASIKNE